MPDDPGCRSLSIRNDSSKSIAGPVYLPGSRPLPASRGKRRDRSSIIPTPIALIFQSSISDRVDSLRRLNWPLIDELQPIRSIADSRRRLPNHSDHKRLPEGLSAVPFPEAGRPFRLGSRDKAKAHFFRTAHAALALRSSAAPEQA
jgi:hypothetical protein